MKKEIIIKGIIVLGALFCLNPYTLIFIGLPIYFLGLILLFVKNNRLQRKQKIKWAIYPFASVLLIYLLVMSVFYLFKL